MLINNKIHIIIKENRIVVESNCDNIIKEITVPIIAKMGNLL